MNFKLKKNCVTIKKKSEKTFINEKKKNFIKKKVL